MLIVLFCLACVQRPAATLPARLRLNRGLDIAGEACPRTTAVNTELETLMLCSESKADAQFETFEIHCFEHHCRKLQGSSFEVVVIVRVFVMSSVVFAWCKLEDERTSHRDVEAFICSIVTSPGQRP